MRFNHIWLPWRWNVGKLIVMRFSIPRESLLMHDLLMINSSVFHLNESMSGSMFLWAPPVGRRPAILPKIVVHCPVETLVLSAETHFLSHRKHFIKKMVVLFLDCRSFPLKVMVSQWTVTVVIVTSWRLGIALRGCWFQELLLELFSTASISRVVVNQLFINYLVFFNWRYWHCTCTCSY